MHITFNKGMAGKWDGDINLTDHKFGRNWWFWIPYFKWNHGRPWNKLEVLDFGMSWLCFWWGFTIYPIKHDNSGQCSMVKKNVE